MEILLGIPIGIACSIIAWWIIFHIITPKIEFSKEIGKKEYSQVSGQPTYRVRLRNCGRRRIIDLKVLFMLTLKAKNNYNTYYIEPRSEFRPYLERNDYLIINMSYSNLPKILSNQVQEGKSFLEELILKNGSGTLELIVFGTDSFSGTRKLFTSKRYTDKDVKLGLFARNSLNIVYPASRTDSDADQSPDVTED